MNKGGNKKGMRQNTNNECFDASPFYISTFLSEERNQYARRHRRTDDTGNITGHTVIQYVVLRVVLGSDFIAYAACHRHGAQSRRTNQRINLLLGEQIEQFHKEDTARNGQGKCRKRRQRCR